MTPTLAFVLAELCEDGVGSDRALDARIHCALTDRILHPGLPEGYTMEDQGIAHKNSRLARGEFITRHRGPAPRYTSSLDDAVKIFLVLPDQIPTSARRVCHNALMERIGR